MDCTPIDECAAGDHNCDENATCSDTVRSYTCECNEGKVEKPHLL